VFQEAALAANPLFPVGVWETEAMELQEGIPEDGGKVVVDAKVREQNLV